MKHHEKKNQKRQDKTLALSLSLSEALDLAKHPEKLGCVRDANKRRASEALKEGLEKWKGGTYASLFKTPNMKRFKNARAELEKSGLAQKVVTKMGVVNKRIRRMSEHDGDWSYDRRYEIQPFSSTKRQQAAVRIVQLDCNFAISCSGDAKQIDAYGAKVWAISDLLESIGFQTQINYVLDSIGIADNLDNVIRVEIKKPGQYMAPTELAKVFTSNFWRRVGFALIVKSADLAGKDVHSWLGRPNRSKTDHISFEDGVLTLRPDTRYGDSSRVEEEILKAVGLKPAA